MDKPVDRSVVSADGTVIALSEVGTGPWLVVVGDAFEDRSSPRMHALADSLGDRFRIVTFDRRGRGESGDTLPWSVDREVEDLTAVVDSLDGSVSALGTCTGAGLVLLALGAGTAIDRAVVYEPPYRPATDAENDDILLADHLDRFVRSERPSVVLRKFLGRVLGMSAAQVSALRLRRSLWRHLLEVAPLLPRDVRLMTDLAVPERVLGAIGVPVLVVAGTDSSDRMKTAARELVEAIHGSEHTTLADQGHIVRADAIGPLLDRFVRRHR